MKMEIKIERTKRGFPALWERGGGRSNTGGARIIAGPSGERKEPVYIKRRGDLACKDHALFVVRPGDLIISASHHRGDFEIYVYRISKIKNDEDIAEVERIHEYSNGEWDIQPPEELADAITSAKQKALCYHCREPHYFSREV